MSPYSRIRFHGHTGIRLTGNSHPPGGDHPVDNENTAAIMVFFITGTGPSILSAMTGMGSGKSEEPALKH